MRLKLKFDRPLEVKTERHNLIVQLDQALDGLGEYLFKLPEYLINQEGETVWLPTSLEFVTHKPLECIAIIQEQIRGSMYEGKCRLQFDEKDYDLLEIRIPPYSFRK